MIANFVLMGELYQHNPFDTLAAPWSTYPWQIGLDNGLSFDTGLVEFSMQKTRWNIDDDPNEQGLSVLFAGMSDIVMFATLIAIDMWGNIGSDVGNDPDPIPPEHIAPTVTGATVLWVTSEAALIVLDSNVEQPDEQGFISVTGANVLSVSSMETLIVRDSNREQPNEQGFISLTGATVLSVTSNQV